MKSRPPSVKREDPVCLVPRALEELWEMEDVAR